MSFRTAIFTILISIPVVPATAFYVALVAEPFFGWLA